jgi:hypothetical protein
MTISGADLLEVNGGELLVAFWPSLNQSEVEALLDAYVAEGTIKTATLTDDTARDLAIASWGYVRAYRAILARLAVEMPAQESLVDEGSATITGDQFRTLENLLAGHQATFDTLVPPITTGSLPNVSRAVNQITVW